MRISSFFAALVVVLLPVHSFQAHSEIRRDSQKDLVAGNLERDLRSTEHQVKCLVLGRSIFLAATLRDQKRPLPVAASLASQDLDADSAALVQRLTQLVYQSKRKPSEAERRVLEICNTGTDSFTPRLVDSRPPICEAFHTLSLQAFEAKKKRFKEKKVIRFWTRNLKSKVHRSLVETVIADAYHSNASAQDTAAAVRARCSLQMVTAQIF